MKTFVEVPVRGAIKRREPSDAELSEASSRRTTIDQLVYEKKRIQDEIDKLIESCPHVVCTDIEGWIRDRRLCFGCGKDKGEV